MVNVRLGIEMRGLLWCNARHVALQNFCLFSTLVHVRTAVWDYQNNLDIQMIKTMPYTAESFDLMFSTSLCTVDEYTVS